MLAPSIRIIRIRRRHRARARVDDLGARAVEKNVGVRRVHIVRSSSVLLFFKYFEFFSSLLLRGIRRSALFVVSFLFEG